MISHECFKKGYLTCGIFIFMLCSGSCATAKPVDKQTIDEGQHTVILQKNKPFAAQVVASNTTYEIQSSFDLAQNQVAIPEGCVLKFNGGSVKNGTLKGNNTEIISAPIKIFGPNLSLDGEWNVSSAYAEWFGAKGNGKNDDTKSIQQAIDVFSRVDLLNSTYRISSITLTSGKKIKGVGPYQSKLIAVDNKKDGIVVASPKRTKYVEIEGVQISGFKNGLHFSRSERCKLTDVISNNCAECACLFDDGCWIMVLRNCKFHNSKTGFSCGLDGVITSTFDLHSCCFYENKCYGFDGVCNNINFFGGYSELNGISGMRFNIKKPSLNVLFLGFDMESNKRYGIDFSTDDKPAENTAYVVNFHYIGGQIETQTDGTNDNASIYFGGPKLSSNYWLNVNFNTRVTGSSAYVIKSMGNIAIEGSMQLTTSGKKWTTSHSVAVDPVTIGSSRSYMVNLSDCDGTVSNKKLIIEPGQQVMVPMGSLCSLDKIKIEGTQNATLSIFGVGLSNNELRSRASSKVVLNTSTGKKGGYCVDTDGFRGVRGIRFFYIKNEGTDRVAISSITLTGQETTYQTISELLSE